MKPVEDINKFRKDRDSGASRPPVRQFVFPETDVKTMAIYFYGDIGIGAAERKCADEQGNDLYLCAYYNRRVPGKYEFVSEYQFYAAKKSISRDLYWNLGLVQDESVILERYDGTDAASASLYGELFIDLKNHIVDLLRELKENHPDPFDIGGSLFSYTTGQGISLAYTVCEMPVREKKEFIQLYFTGDKLKRLSRSPVPLENLMRFLPDFDTLDSEQLHLRTFLPPAENALRNGSPYHEMYCEALDSIAFDRTVTFD